MLFILISKYNFHLLLAAADLSRWNIWTTLTRKKSSIAWAGQIKNRYRNVSVIFVVRRSHFTKCSSAMRTLDRNVCMCFFFSYKRVKRVRVRFLGYKTLLRSKRTHLGYTHVLDQDKQRCQNEEKREEERKK